MLHFENDYNEGAHIELLKALIETNEENLEGYGLDSYCKEAAEKIKLAWPILSIIVYTRDI